MLAANGISTPRDFLTYIANPDIADFAKEITDLRVAHHACISLLSLRDWVVKHHNGKTWNYQSRLVGTLDARRPKQGFGHDLVGIEKDFKVIFDIANASKHMILAQSQRLTTLHGSANVSIQILSTGSSSPTPAASGADAGPTRALVKIGSDYHDVLLAAQAVHAVWTTLFAENGW
jgi:hypothetical protein